MGSVEEERASLLRGQAQVWDMMFAFADSLSLKAAVELRVPDIIHSHGGPITLSQLASSIYKYTLFFSLRRFLYNFIFTKSTQPTYTN